MTLGRLRVAIVGHRRAPGAAVDDLYPDDDWPVLQDALEAVGVDAVALSWDDDGVVWRGLDAAVIRSTWDSVDRPREYLAWSQATSRATTLLNPHAAVAWNLDKTYLSALQARGVSVVPTDWVTDESRWEVPSHEFVIKPSVSAGGRETARYDVHEAKAAQSHLRRLLAAGRTAMVQPYVKSVDSDGEAKVVFIDGKVSHAVRVGALLGAGEGVLERPWEKSVSVTVMAPTATQIDAAEKVLAAAQATIGRSVLYARVDLVTAPTGEPLLAELELNDSSLLLRIEPAAADRLAQTIKGHVQLLRRRR